MVLVSWEQNTVSLTSRLLILVLSVLYWNLEDLCHTCINMLRIKLSEIQSQMF